MVYFPIDSYSFPAKMGPPPMLATGEVHKWELAFPQAREIKMNELVMGNGFIALSQFSSTSKYALNPTNSLAM